MRVTGGDFSICNNENYNVLLLRGNEKRVFCVALSLKKILRIVR